MATICLRRTKGKGLLGLPQKIMEICYIDLSAEERELYDRMEVEAKTVVRDYISADRVTRNYTTVLSIILRLRQICTDVDLCPKDLIASLPPSNIEGILQCIPLFCPVFIFIDYITCKARRPICFLSLCKQDLRNSYITHNLQYHSISYLACL